MASKLRWVDRARIGRENPNNNKIMGNRKKLEAFKESVIRLVSTFSAKLSCALVLASLLSLVIGTCVKYMNMYDFGCFFRQLHSMSV